jgi:hypothetical protein
LPIGLDGGTWDFPAITERQAERQLLLGADIGGCPTPNCRMTERGLKLGCLISGKAVRKADVVSSNASFAQGTVAADSQDRRPERPSDLQFFPSVSFCRTFQTGI